MGEHTTSHIQCNTNAYRKPPSLNGCNIQFTAYVIALHHKELSRLLLSFNIVDILDYLENMDTRMQVIIISCGS